MLKFCVGVATVMLVSHNLCLAQQPASYDGREGYLLDRPQWISALAIEADVIRELGEANLESDAPVADKSLIQNIRACYSWELDVAPTVRMAELLVQRYPEKAVFLQSIFERRVSSRTADRDLFEKEAKTAVVDEVVAEIRERECHRTQVLSDSLEEVLLPLEGEAFVSELLSGVGVRAFCFPYVADFFGLSDAQLKSIRKSNLDAHKRMELAKSSNDKSRIIDIQKGVFLATIRNLPSDALRSYLLATKKLNDGEPLTASIPRFPDDCHEALRRIILAHLDS